MDELVGRQLDFQNCQKLYRSFLRDSGTQKSQSDYRIDTAYGRVDWTSALIDRRATSTRSANFSS